jgi:Ca2+-binding EF-hand superfamily protein
MNYEMTENIQKLLPGDFDQMVRESFDSIDTDKNNFLSLEELMPLLNDLARMAGHHEEISLEEAKVAMRHLDKNGDQKVDLEEFKRLFFVLLMQYLGKQGDEYS